MLADFSANLQMIFAPNTYSRTQRIGELYEEEIFSRVDDGNGMKPRYMSDLLIQPAGEPLSFSPKVTIGDGQRKFLCLFSTLRL